VIIFVEGADEAGKTHIAKTLAKLYGLQYWKNEDGPEFFAGSEGGFKKLLKYHYSKLPKMCNMLESLGSGIIFDRNYISESVYSNVYGRETHPEIIAKLEDTYAAMGAITIYCYKTEYKKFQDDHIRFHEIADIQAAYSIYIDFNSRMPVLMLNTTDENLESQLEKIAYFIKGINPCNTIG